MAILTLNQLLEAIRGKIGGLVIRRRPDGALIISGAPHYRKGKGSPKQKAYRQHFKYTARHARGLAKVHPIYAELAAAARDKWLSPYNFALADCLKPPVIHRIERGDGCIRVEASDNVQVTKVRVTVRDEGGTVLASGNAARGAENWWEFACQTEGKTIVAEAWDLPMNHTKFVM